MNGRGTPIARLRFEGIDKSQVYDLKATEGFEVVGDVLVWTGTESALPQTGGSIVVKVVATGPNGEQITAEIEVSVEQLRQSIRDQDLPGTEESSNNDVSRMEQPRENDYSYVLSDPRFAVVNRGVLKLRDDQSLRTGEKVSLEIVAEHVEGKRLRKQVKIVATEQQENVREESGQFSLAAGMAGVVIAAFRFPTKRRNASPRTDPV